MEEFMDGRGRDNNRKKKNKKKNPLLCTIILSPLQVGKTSKSGAGLHSTRLLSAHETEEESSNKRHSFGMTRHYPLYY